MGKAAVDLPDPLQQSTSSASPMASADDLLSQLAGDEIDRLLAEADAERPAPAAPTLAGEPGEETAPPTQMQSAVHLPSPAPAPAATTPAVADVSPATIALPNDEAFPDPDRVAATPAPGAPAAGGEAVSQQLDDLFAELNGTPAAEATSADAKVAPAPSVAEAPVAAAAVAATLPAQPTAVAETPAVDEQPMSAKELDQALAQAAPSLLVDADDASVAPAPPTASLPTVAEASSADAGTSKVERSLLDTLDAPAATDEDSPETPAGAGISDLDDIEAPLPIYLKPLVWMNAPFASLPEPMRESLGKVAVLTLVNAIAVLLYVLLFRHH